MKFAICIKSDGFDDLENWKVYRTLPDETAGEVDCVRAVDDSGEDYLYPSNRFLMVEFSEEIEGKLLGSMETTS